MSATAKAQFDGPERQVEAQAFIDGWRQVPALRWPPADVDDVCSKACLVRRQEAFTSTVYVEPEEEIDPRRAGEP